MTLKIEKNGPLFRLKEIEPDEVSLVDRAANKRKFIVVKQEDEMPGSEVVEQDGVMVLKDTEDQNQQQSTDGDQVEKPVVKFELSLSPDQKAELSSKMQEAMERVLEVTNSVRAAKEDSEGGDGKSDALLSEIRSIKSLMDEVDKMLSPQDAAAGDGGAATAEGGSTPTIGKDASEEEIRKAAETHAKLLQERIDTVKSIAQDIADNAGSMELTDLRSKLSTLSGLGWRIEELAEVVNLSKRDEDEDSQTQPAAVAGLTEEELEAIKKGDVEALEKIGRKMSAKNLGRFKRSISEMEKVIKTFLELYKVLLPMESEKRDLAKRMLESIGVTQDSDYQEQNVGSGKQPDPQARGDMAENAGAEGEMKRQLADLQKRLEEKDKKLAKQTEQIKKLGSTVEAPSSAKPETSVKKQRDATGGDDEVNWGMDLNDERYLKREGLD